MKNLILIFLFVISFQVYSQSDSTNINLKVLKFSALSFRVPYVGSSVRMSFEYGLSQKITLEHEFGLIFYDSKGYILRSDIKKYLNLGRNSNYFGFDLFYKNQSYSTSDSISNKYLDYHVNKNVLALSMKYGEVTTYKFGLVLDFYVGAGLRFIENQNSLNAEENNNMQATSDYGPNLIMNKAGTRFYPNILFGLKIGYRFNN